MGWEKFEYATTDVVMPAKICVIDEYASFVNVTDRKDMRLVDQLTSNIEKIAALGRSAHIHLVIATQSPTGNLFPTSLKNNISERIICGRVESNISQLAIGNDAGESLPLTPGTYMGYSKDIIQRFQGYFTEIEDVLALGTVKPGFDPKTGQPLDDFDLSSPIEDHDTSSEGVVEEQPMEEIEIGNSDDGFDSGFDFNSFLGINEDGEFENKEKTPAKEENDLLESVSGTPGDIFDDLDLSLLDDVPGSFDDSSLGGATPESSEEASAQTATPKIKINLGGGEKSGVVKTTANSSSGKVKINLGGSKKKEEPDDYDPYGVEEIKKNRDKYSGGSIILS